MITQYFIHVHVPRTGGQQIRLLVAHALPGAAYFEDLTHASVQESRIKLAEVIGEKRAQESVAFCFVRNPWDWYVSRYFFRNQRKHWRGEEIVPADFCGSGKDGFRKHMELLKHAIETDTQITNEDGKTAATRTYKPVTLSQWHAKLADGKIDRIGRFERFQEDLENILVSAAPVEVEDIRRRLGYIKVNASEHREYRHYYDGDMANWVARWDADYIEEFGYSFEEKSSL